MDRHHRDSGIAPEVKDELSEEGEEIVLSSDSEHSAEDQVPGGDIIPGGFMDNVEVPELQHIPEDNNQEDNANQNLPEADNQEENQNIQPDDDQPANNDMAAQGVQGSQISSIPVFSGIAGVDGAAFADAIDQARDSSDGLKRRLPLLLKPEEDLL